jgi:hypothetical protein
MNTDANSSGERSTLSAWLARIASFSDRPIRDAPPFQIGDVLLDRYVLERELGRGGMGVVYEALDRDQSVRCALKTLRAIGPEGVVMLKNEFRSIARIQHANLVRPGELREHATQWFYTMEIVEGRDPVTWTGGELQRVRTVLLGLADVLAAIHAQGVVHRDVKPANVIATDQRTVLLDLGLARDARRRLWFDRDEVGTTKYMAPELLAGGSASPASDMYSLGVLLFEIACANVRSEAAHPDRSIVARRGSAFAELDEICRELLSTDPACRPTAADLVARLGGTTTLDVPRKAELVGRTNELERLRGAYDHARDGNFAAMFVHGPSGIGKTALVEELVARCNDAIVLSGRCYECETVPFKALDDIVDAIAALLATRPEVVESLPSECAALGHAFPSIAALLRVTSPRDPETANRAAAGALHAMLVALARTAPLILVIDDLQWIDDDGLRLFASVIALAPPRCFVVATTRAAERPDALVALGSALTMQLPPLSSDDAARLARSIAPASEHELSRILDAARGQPYIICELASRASGTRSELSPGARHVLELVAVAGAPLQARVLAAASRLTVASLEECLRELEVHRFVRWRGVGEAAMVEPFHDRVREESSRDLPSADATAAHGDLADALLALTPDAEATIAVHLARAHRPVEAAVHALRAARRADETGAFAHAASLYALALESGIDDQAIRERHAEALLLAWQPDAAATAFRAAATSASPEHARGLRIRGIEQRLIGGDLSRGLDELAEALRDAGVSVPRRRWSALATMLIRRAELRLRRFRLRRDRLTTGEIDLLGWASSTVMMIDAPLALGYHTRALLAILDLEDPVRLARSLSTEACIQAATASLQEAERLIGEIEKLGTDEQVQPALRPPRMVLGVQRGAWHDVIAIGSRPGPTHTAWHNASRELYLAHCEFNLGRFGDLERRCRRGLDSAKEREDRWLELVLSVSFAPMVALVHDDPETARAIIDRGRALLWRGGHGGYLHALSACASAFVDLYTERYDNALGEWVGPGSDTIARKSHYGRVYLEFLGGTAALGAMRGGSTRRLRKRVDRSIDILSRAPLPWAAPFASLLGAQIDPSNRAARLASAREGFARFEIAHMVDVIDRVVDSDASGADARLRERGVVRPERFVAMFAPLISPT